MLHFMIPAIVGAVAAAAAYEEYKKGRKKHKKKAKKQGQHKIEKRSKEKRQAIRELADSFVHESLRNITYERLKDAGDNLEELQVIYGDETYAHDIELDAYILINPHYRQAIMQRLLDAYSARNREELQAIADDAQRFRYADLLTQSIESCVLSEALQQITKERMAGAGLDTDELQKINKEVFCVYEIEQYCKEWDAQSRQEIYKDLENAYRNRDFETLQEILLEARKPKAQEESRPITIKGDGVSCDSISSALRIESIAQAQTVQPIYHQSKDSPENSSINL